MEEKKSQDRVTFASCSRWAHKPVFLGERITKEDKKNKETEIIEEPKQKETCMRGKNNKEIEEKERKQKKSWEKEKYLSFFFFFLLFNFPFIAPKQNLQDTLRLLTLWFSHANNRNIEKAVQAGFDVINIDTWLSVIPQIIAYASFFFR